ncbi:methylmalonic aciduria and homocystinuria type D protein [Candidatus Dependentiae bacterium]|nr:methylmalonic aciduria and homocystinuria type D protein [Candidatus Dependentiae bacterium]
MPACVRSQRTKMDLVQTGEGVDTEKDFCLERFISFAKRITDRLIADGHWADYIDPCSGLSMLNKDSQQIYGEVDALVTLLNYQTTNTGCCKVVLHPTWGSAVYPASIFTKAPVTGLHEVFLEVEAEIRAEDLNA